MRYNPSWSIRFAVGGVEPAWIGNVIFEDFSWHLARSSVHFRQIINILIQKLSELVVRVHISIRLTSSGKALRPN